MPDLVVTCDGCGSAISLEIVSDDSDPNKGVLIDEQYYGKCEQCNYEFTVRKKMEQKDDQS
jgi:hypothetical protein